jgi:RNA polymerase sigma-70 factor, ECF subfamily
MGNEPHVPRASVRDQSTTEPLSGNHEERFLKAFDEYSDALFRHASIRLSDRERAVELTHDTFLKAWGYTRSGHEIESYRPFLYKILNNLIIDEYRKRKEDSLDALLEREGVDEGSFEELHTSSLEVVVDTMDARRAVEAIAGLPDTYREVLTLRFVDGLTPKEISLLIEETENVVSVRLHRGIKALKVHIESKKRKNDTTQ